MIKKAFNILLISILALNLAGGWVFASSLDCGAKCCENGGQAETFSFEISSCCTLDEVNCGFGTGHHQGLFDKAICHHAGTQRIPTKGSPDAAPLVFTDSPGLSHPISRRSAGLAKTLPVYLSNASLIC